MRKKLEVDLYRTALSVVHRLLAYQIKHKSKIGKIMVLLFESEKQANRK